MAGNSDGLEYDGSSDDHPDDHPDDYLYNLPAVLSAEEKVCRRRVKSKKYLWTARGSYIDQKMYQRNRASAVRIKDRVLSREARFRREADIKIKNREAEYMRSMNEETRLAAVWCINAFLSW